MISATLTACVTYWLFLMIHWIPFRLISIQRRTRTMSLCLLAVFPTIPFIFYFFSECIRPELDYGGLAGSLFFGAGFVLLWCGYVQFVFAFDTSPSLRVLVTLLKHPQGMSENDLVQTINFADIFRRRFFRSVQGSAIDALEKQGQPTRFSLPRKSIRFARTGKAAKQFFKLGAGG